MSSAGNPRPTFIGWSVCPSAASNAYSPWRKPIPRSARSYQETRSTWSCIRRRAALTQKKNPDSLSIRATQICIVPTNLFISRSQRPQEARCSAQDSLEAVEDGYEFWNDRTLVTVFSAPNYCGGLSDQLLYSLHDIDVIAEFDNYGACMTGFPGLGGSPRCRLSSRGEWTIHRT